MARSSDRPVIYLIGTSGWPNYGDELITAGWLRFYAEHLPDAEVWLDSQRPGQSAVLHGRTHPNLRCTDTLYHACWNAPSVPAEASAFGAQVVVEPGLIPREASGVDVLAHADLIHVLGGGFINSMWPQHYALLGAASEAAGRSGATTALTGAGLFPAEAAEELLRSTLSAFTIVDVRDKQSEAILDGSVPALSRTGDDAFLDLQKSPVRSGPVPATVLCLQEDLLGVSVEVLTDYVVRTLQSWGVDKDPVLLLECLPPGDLHMADALSQSLPNLELMPFAELWTDGFPVRRGQRWMSTRFHPHLMAAAAGVWGVAIASVDYYRTKHQSLVDLGSGWTIAESFDDIVDPGSLAAAPYAGDLPGMQRAKRAIAATALEALRT